MDLQDALDEIGGFRRWHIFAFLQLTFGSFIPYTMHLYGIVFTAWVPPHRCKGLENHAPNLTEFEKKCYEPVNLNISNDIQKCSNGWTFDSDGYNTIVTEFQLVCDKDYYFDVSAFIVTSFLVVSGVLGSYFVDRYGRKRVYIITYFIVPIFSAAAAFAPNLWSHVLLKCVGSIVVAIMAKAGCTLLFELYGPKTRAYPGIGLEFIWTLCLLIPCLLGYLCKDWRLFQLVGSLLSLVLLPGLLFLVESPMWLFAKKRYGETRAIIDKLTRWNGVKRSDINIKLDRIDTCGEETDHDIKNTMIVNGTVNTKISHNDKLQISSKENADSGNTGVPIRDLFCDQKLRIHLMLCMFFIFAVELVYTGLTLSSPSFGPNRFINYVLFGVIEIPCTPITLLLVNKLGRKIPLSVIFIAAGIPLLIIGFIPQKPEYEILILSLAVAGKFGNMSAYCVAFLFMRELFPTTLRDSGAAWSYVGGGIGTCMSPLAAYLVKKIFWLPNVMFAVISIIAGIAVIPLPETSNKPMPETTQDVYVVLYGQKVKTNNKHLANC